MMGSVAEGIMEQINCTRRQLTTTTDMVPDSLTTSDGDVISSVSSTTVMETAGPSSTIQW